MMTVFLVVRGIQLVCVLVVLFAIIMRMRDS